MEIQPEVLLPLGDTVEQKYLLDEDNGKNILIVGNKISILGEEYYVYVVRDISSVYEDIRKMGLRFFAIGALCIAAGIALIILFVRLAVRANQKNWEIRQGRSQKGNIHSGRWSLPMMKSENWRGISTVWRKL